jgi:hypothetical protein
MNIKKQEKSIVKQEQKIEEQGQKIAEQEQNIKKQETRFIGYNAQIAELKDDHIKLNEAVCASLSKGSKPSKSWHGLSCMTRSSVRSRSRSNSSNTSSGGTRKKKRTRRLRRRN